MNKFVLAFFIVLFSFLSFSFADLVIDKSNDKILNINTAVEIPPLWDLENITVKFCDNLKIKDKEDLLMRPWQTKDICIVFFNTAKTGDDIKAIGQFSQGILQANWVPNCSNVYSSWEIFSLISTYTSWYFNVSLAPWEKAIKHIKIAVPKTMTWNKDMYGCLVYQLDRQKPENFSWIFYIVNAKASYIHLQVAWPVYKKQFLDTIMLFRQDNKLRILKIFGVILWILLVYYLSLSFTNKSDDKHHHKK